MEFEFQPGDIAACYGRDLVSRAISLRTLSLWPPIGRLFWGPSHVAIFCEHPSAGMIWVESTTLCRHPCLFRDGRVSGAQAHYPWDRIEDYVNPGGRVDLYRLVEVDQLDKAESSKLTEILLQRFVRRGIDYDMGGALLSGTRVLRHVPWLLGSSEQARQAVFCSMLIAFSLQRINKMNRANPRKFSPGRMMRQLVGHYTYRFETSLPSIQPATLPMSGASAA